MQVALANLSVCDDWSPSAPSPKCLATRKLSHLKVAAAAKAQSCRKLALMERSKCSCEGADGSRRWRRMHGAKWQQRWRQGTCIASIAAGLFVNTIMTVPSAVSGEKPAWSIQRSVLSSATRQMPQMKQLLE